MSRFDDFDGEIVPENLWRHRVEQALHGKRGQRALHEIRDALLALPTRRLISGALCEAAADGSGVEFCAIGAWSFHRRTTEGEDPVEVLESLAGAGEQDGEPYDTCHEAQRLGITWTLAWELAQRNDDERYSPEKRYREYLAWVESQIVPQSA